MAEIDVKRHKKAMRMGIHFYVSAIKKDQESAENLIKSVKEMDKNDVYSFMMGMYLTTFIFSKILADLVGISQDELAKKATEMLNEEDILDSVYFDAD